MPQALSQAQEQGLDTGIDRFRERDACPVIAKPFSACKIRRQGSDLLATPARERSRPVVPNATR